MNAGRAAGVLLMVTLFVVAFGRCGTGTAPSGPVDAGPSDGGVLDAGQDDAGEEDAGDPNHLCDPADPETCPPGESCLMYLQPAGVFGTDCFPGACDLVAQDCDAGLKCTHLTDDGGSSVRACLPEGDATEGEPCSRGPVTDNCARGLICLPELQPDGGVTAACARYCGGADDCAAEDACFLAVEPEGSMERPLVCDRPCDLFSQDCPVGRGCYPGPVAPGCYPAGTLPQDASCTYSDECSPGAACVNARCTPLCALPSDPPTCAAGTCTFLDVPRAPDAGACLEQ